MKLDRNINPDGGGKYALLKMRRIREIKEVGEKPHPHETKEYGLNKAVIAAIGVLDRAGCIHWGNEGLGEQFFVMKYKDRFTSRALRAYAEAIHDYRYAHQNLSLDEHHSLQEYEEGIEHESVVASGFGKQNPS